MFFALFYPNGFIFALGFAAIALAVLSLILPPLLVRRSRRMDPAGYRVAGGNPALWGVFVLGLGIILIQLLIVAGWLPDVG